MISTPAFGGGRGAAWVVRRDHRIALLRLVDALQRVQYRSTEGAVTIIPSLKTADLAARLAPMQPCVPVNRVGHARVGQRRALLVQTFAGDRCVGFKVVDTDTGAVDLSGGGYDATGDHDIRLAQTFVDAPAPHPPIRGGS